MSRPHTILDGAVDLSIDAATPGSKANFSVFALLLLDGELDI